MSFCSVAERCCGIFLELVHYIGEEVRTENILVGTGGLMMTCNESYFESRACSSQLPTCCHVTHYIHDSTHTWPLHAVHVVVAVKK